MAGGTRPVKPILNQNWAPNATAKRRSTRYPEPREAVMSQATIDRPDIKTLADLRERLGGIALERIWFHPRRERPRKRTSYTPRPEKTGFASWSTEHWWRKRRGLTSLRVAIELAYLVKSYLEREDLGICVGADGIMRIAPGLVRIPDLSFISWDRLPGRETPSEPIPDLAPDLAVEVLSEGNTKAEMARKVREYFEAGVILVWLIDPKKRTARVFSSVEKSTLIRADQALDGGVVLPGFTLVLSELLDRGRRPRKG